MAREKKRKGSVIKIGERYECAECHAEVPIKQACPKCKKELDWDRVLGEVWH
jgi:primosomal protein N'